MPHPLRLTAPVLLLCASLAARADSAAKGLEADLPAPLLGNSCQTPQDLRLERAAAYVRKGYLPLKLETATIHGLKLTDDSRALEVLRRSLGKVPPSTWPRAEACRNTLCALREALNGQLESALWVLAIGAESDAVPSLDQAWNRGAGDSLWKDTELRLLGKATLDLPATLKRGTNWQITRRMPDGANWFNGANAWSMRTDEGLQNKAGAIWLRDTVWKMPPRAFREVMAHEAGHQLEYAKATKDTPFPISHSPHWLILSGWEKVGDPRTKEGYRLPRYGPDISSTGEPALASEDFPDSIADYRYRPRLLRAYSRGKHELIKKLLGGAEFNEPSKNPALDVLFKRLGGPLTAMMQCASLIQRAYRRPFAPQAQLYVVRWKKGSGSYWSTQWRNFFVDRSPCLETTMETLKAQPEWRDLACKSDPDDLEFQVAERLEDVWGAYAEAAGLIEATLPPNWTGTCSSRGELTMNCLAGPRGWPLALSEARRLMTEYDRPRENPETLARQLATQTVLFPPDDEVVARISALKDPRELFTACLFGVIELSTPPNNPTWSFWVRNPPKNDIRGFSGPAWTNACNRDFAVLLKQRGLTVDPGDAIYDHYTYLLKNQTGPLLDRLNTDILQQWRSLSGTCLIPNGGKTSEADPICVLGWLLPRVQSFAAPGLDRQVAAHLASIMRGP